MTTSFSNLTGIYCRFAVEQKLKTDVHWKMQMIEVNIETDTEIKGKSYHSRFKIGRIYWNSIFLPNF